MRVVMLILDSMAHAALNANDTPNLWAQGLAGAMAPKGGMSLPVSVTYSNHAAFVTGVDPVVTKLWGNKGWTGSGFEDTATMGPCAPTLFDRCKAAGLTSVAAVGDHHIVTAIGAQAADQVWPPTAVVPEGTPVDEYGYAADEAVISAAARMNLKSDFVVLHLNEPDTTFHVYGPESPEAQEQVRKSDEAYGQLIQLLQDGWEDTVVFSISDHCQEQITEEVAINLRGELESRDWPAVVHHDGTAAIVVSELTPAQVSSVDGVEGATQADEQTIICWTEPGFMFGKRERYTMGNHGSPRCRQQVAIVSGGHPKVKEIAQQFLASQPTTLTYAPLIANLLKLPA